MDEYDGLNYINHPPHPEVGDEEETGEEFYPLTYEEVEALGSLDGDEQMNAAIRLAFRSLTFLGGKITPKRLALTALNLCHHGAGGLDYWVAMLQPSQPLWQQYEAAAEAYLEEVEA